MAPLLTLLPSVLVRLVALVPPEKRSSSLSAVSLRLRRRRMRSLSRCRLLKSAARECRDTNARHRDCGSGAAVREKGENRKSETDCETKTCHNGVLVRSNSTATTPGCAKKRPVPAENKTTCALSVHHLQASMRLVRRPTYGPLLERSFYGSLSDSPVNNSTDRFAFFSGFFCKLREWTRTWCTITNMKPSAKLVPESMGAQAERCFPANSYRLPSTTALSPHPVAVASGSRMLRQTTDRLVKFMLWNRTHASIVRSRRGVQCSTRSAYRGE